MKFMRGKFPLFIRYKTVKLDWYVQVMAGLLYTFLTIKANTRIFSYIATRKL